MENNTARKI